MPKMNNTEERTQAVWEKGHVVARYDADLYRKDDCGAWIVRNKYGKTNSLYGWQIHHIVPESEGGSDALSNLRPLQWKNNQASQAGPLKCPVTAVDNENVNSG